MAEENIEPLITECPNCQTRFRVTESQLQIAAGRVRCGACLTVFQGVDHLLWDNEPVFGSDTDAQSALDELLDELGGAESGIEHGAAAADDRLESHAGRTGGQRSEPDGRAEPIATEWHEPDWSRLPHQLYGGHEESSDLEFDELRHVEEGPGGAESSTAEPATDASSEPAFEFESEPEADSKPVFEFEAEPEADSEDLTVEEAEQRQLEEILVRTAAERPPPRSDQPGATAAVMPVVAASADESAVERHFVFGREPGTRRWWMTAATVAALLALVGQVLWYQFAVWARDPDLRPMYGAICAVIGCDLPIMRDLDSLLAQNLIVRTHPEVANALQVDAIIVNQASFVQPFPVLELRFTSLDGNLVAGRRFQPQEYLAGELTGATVMPSRTPIHVELEIEDPGIEAVNYFLTFR